MEGRGAPNNVHNIAPGLHQAQSCAQSRFFPHAAHTALMLLQVNVRGTHRCDSLSSYIPAEPDNDDLS